MTTYKDIHGTKVEVRTDDPANPVNGQVWYNSGTLKGFKLNPTGAWATGNNTNTPARANRGHGTQGTQTAALATGGGNPVIANVESYDGTSWTEIADLNVAKHLAILSLIHI